MMRIELIVWVFCGLLALTTGACDPLDEDNIGINNENPPAVAMLFGETGLSVSDKLVVTLNQSDVTVKMVSFVVHAPVPSSLTVEVIKDDAVTHSETMPVTDMYTIWTSVHPNTPGDTITFVGEKVIISSLDGSLCAKVCGNLDEDNIGINNENPPAVGMLFGETGLSVSRKLVVTFNQTDVTVKMVSFVVHAPVASSLTVEVIKDDVVTHSETMPVTDMYTILMSVHPNTPGDTITFMGEEVIISWLGGSLCA